MSQLTASETAMPDKTPRQAFTSHENINVPPDTLRVRRETITASMLGQLHAPATTTTGLFRGYGLYTHAEIPTPQDAPRFAHQKYLAPGMRPTFLPLGGPQRVRDQIEGDEQLPKEVLRVYESLKDALLKEEAKEKNGKKNYHSERMECLGLPDVLVPPPPSRPPPRKVEMVSAVIQGYYWPEREQRNLRDSSGFLNEDDMIIMDHDVTTSHHTPEESRDVISASDNERIQPSKTPHSSIVSNGQDRGEILEPTIVNDREANIFDCSSVTTQETGMLWDDIITSSQETVDVRDEMFSNTQDTEDVPDMSVDIWVSDKARRDDHDTNAIVQSQEPISPSTALLPRLPDLPQPTPEEKIPGPLFPSPLLPKVSVGQDQILKTPEGSPVADTPSGLHLSIAPSTQTESRPAPTTFAQSRLPTKSPLVTPNLLMSSPQEDVAMEASSFEDGAIEVDKPVQRAAYKKARLTCNTCRMGLTDLNNLVAHMVKRHTGDLSSTYFRCCSAQSFSGTYTSSSPHWRGVHGWSERPFQCPDCDIYFPSIIEVSKHWKQTHRGLGVVGSDAFHKHRSGPRERGLPAHPKPHLDQQNNQTTDLRRDEEPPSVAPVAKTNFAPQQPTFLKSAAPEAGPSTSISTLPDNSLSKPFQHLRAQCVACSEDYKDIPSLTRHVHKRHFEERTQIRWICCDVNTTFTTTALKHFSEVHGWHHGLPCPLDTCEEKFDSLPQLQKHLKADHSSNENVEPPNPNKPHVGAGEAIECRRCQRRFPNVSAKDKHECVTPPSRGQSRERSRRRSKDWSRRASRRSSTSSMDISDSDHWDRDERTRDKEKTQSSGAKKCSFCGWDAGHSPVCMYR